MLSITTDQLSGAAAYISRNWSDHGYRIEAIDSPTWAVSIFHVVAGDGSRFVIAADKWGNAGGDVDSHGYDTDERTEALRVLVAEMHERATGRAVDVTVAYLPA